MSGLGDALFPGMSGDGGKGGALALSHGGGQITHLSNGGAMASLEAYAVLPNTVTERKIKDTATIVGNRESELFRLQEYSKWIQRDVTAEIGILEAKTAHSAFMQKAGEQIERITGKHANSVARHQLRMGTNQNYVSAYQAGFDTNLQALNGV